MVLLQTGEEWQRQSALLLQARPTTTRITTKYNIPNPESESYQRKLKKRKRDADGEGADGAAAQQSLVGTLTLKTYDPESGDTLKFKTDKAADVGRLIAGLGRMGRHMAALPERDDVPEANMDDAPAVQTTAETVKESAPVATDVKPQQGGGGGGKKKKKNKK